MSTFAVGISGALIGGVLTFLVQTFLAMRNMDIVVINDHIAHITSIESLAVDYWLKAGCDDAKQEQLAAARLRGALASSDGFVDEAKRLLGSSYNEFFRLDGELFDLATGGGFETSNREPVPETAIAIMQASQKLKALLRQRRRNLYWAH